MTSDSKLASDLLLLMVNLSQITNPERVGELFCDAVNELDLGFSMAFVVNEEGEDDSVVRGAFGAYRLVDYPGELSEKNQSIFENGLAMLRVVAQNQQNANLVAKMNEDTGRALDESLELNKRILETSPDMIYVYDLVENRNTYCNRSVESMLGYSPKDLADMGTAIFSKLIHPDDLRLAVEHQERLLNEPTDKVFELEFRMMAKDGTVQWFRSWERVFNRTTDGKALTKIGAAVDVTELRTAEQCLRTSEKRFKAIANCLSDLVFEFDPMDGSITWYGDVRSRVGLEPNTVASLELCLERIHADDRTNFRKAVKRCVAAESELDETVRFEHGDSTYGTWRVRGHFTDDHRLAGACTNVTKEEDLQKRLFHAQKMESVGRLAGGIAHDFNNLLTGIIAPAEMIKERCGTLDRAVRRYAELISKSGIQAADLTSKLLSFSRQNSFRKSSMDLKAVVKEVAAIIKHTFDPSIKLEVELPREELIVFGDVTEIQNGILNLALNARYAMPQGGRLQLRLRSSALCRSELDALGKPGLAPGNYPVIDVVDDGTGIEPKLLSKIFDPFFSTKPEGEGTGLGLAAVYGLMDDHKGAIEVESTVDAGTMVSLIFPECMDKNDPLEEPPALPNGHGRILVIDDERNVLNVIRELLEATGYDVVTENTGVRGIQRYMKESEAIDLCILDLAMPDMGGDKVLAAIRDMNPKAKVVIATGYLVEYQEMDLKAQGAIEVIQKPFRPGQLEVAVSNALHPSVSSNRA